MEIPSKISVHARERKASVCSVITTLTTWELIIRLSVWKGIKRATVIKLYTSKETSPWIKKSKTQPRSKCSKWFGIILHHLSAVLWIYLSVNGIDDTAVRRLPFLSYIYFLWWCKYIIISMLSILVRNIIHKFITKLCCMLSKLSTA